MKTNNENIPGPAADQNGSAHTTASTLLPNHLADLQASGLTLETIRRWGCYSLLGKEVSLLRNLGFGHLQLPALALPVLPPDRGKPDLNDVILKPDWPRIDGRGRPCKYETRAHARNRIHIPLSIRDRITDLSQPVVITEGQKKAEKAAQEGICTLALAGVWNWRDRIGESSFPIADFELIHLIGRRILLVFDSDASSNPQVRKAESDLAAFLQDRFAAVVSVKRLSPNPEGKKVGLDDFLLGHTADEFWALPEQDPCADARASASLRAEWPDPAPLADELPPVYDLTLDLLPTSLRPLVEDVSDLMQTPPDYAAAAAIVALAGCVNRRARIQPKAVDMSWSVIPNLWGAIVAPPGFMKSPLLGTITAPLNRIEGLWRNEHAQELSDFEAAKELAELQQTAWRRHCTQAFSKGQPPPLRPDNSLKPPAQRRLVLTDATFEKLHEILADNPAGVMVVRDELTGWLAELEKTGREGERAFYLQAWNGDTGFTVDRIGRGSIHVPAVCLSLFGNIQPARLRWYLSQTLGGGPTDDGLFQRFQILTSPDLSKSWHLVDRAPSAVASATAEKVLKRLASLSADEPTRMRFGPEAQQLFYVWWPELETKIRTDGGLIPPLVAHLAKYRSLMPALAGLFELADLAAADADMSGEIFIGLEHAQQAAALCEYLESHALRVYSCVVSPELRNARELAQHLQRGDLEASFTTRDVYLKGWNGLDSPERARTALHLLEEATWVRREVAEVSSSGGRPTERWVVNPKVARHEK